MEIIKTEISMFEQSMKKFKYNEPENWKKDDIPKLAGQFQRLLGNWKQTCIDYGLQKDNSIIAPQNVVDFIQTNNTHLKSIKTELHQLLMLREQAIETSQRKNETNRLT